MIRRIAFGTVAIGISVLALIWIDVIYRPLLFMLGGFYTFTLIEAFSHEARNAIRSRTHSGDGRGRDAGVRPDASYSDGTGESGTEH